MSKSTNFRLPIKYELCPSVLVSKLNRSQMWAKMFGTRSHDASFDISSLAGRRPTVPRTRPPQITQVDGVRPKPQKGCE